MSKEIWLPIVIAVITALISAAGSIIVELIKIWLDRKKGKRKERRPRMPTWRVVVVGFLVGAVVGVLIANPWSNGGNGTIVIDSFDDYVDTAEFQDTWETDIPDLTSTNGKTTAAIDTKTFAPGVESRQSLKITTKIPCLLDEEHRQEIRNLPNEEDRLQEYQNLPDKKCRFQQIQRYWISPQDWSNSHVLEIWVKGDGVRQKPWGGELSVVLIDGDDEVWQSTRWFDRRSDWTKITIHLVGSGVGNPWDHQKDFVIPTFEAEEEGGAPPELNTNQIKAIRIKSLTTDDWACGTIPEAEGIKYPDFTIWVDHIARSKMR